MSRGLVHRRHPLVGKQLHQQLARHDLLDALPEVSCASDELLNHPLTSLNQGPVRYMASCRRGDLCKTLHRGSVQNLL
jgi:hypothetical protein